MFQGLSDWLSNLLRVRLEHGTLFVDKHLIDLGRNGCVDT